MEQTTKLNALFMVFAVLIIVVAFFYYFSPKEPKKDVETPKEVIAVEEVVEEAPEEAVAELPEEAAEETKEGPKEAVIEIKWKSFEPTGELTIEKGTTVIWKNADTESPSRTHLISANHWAFKSGNLKEGDSFNHTFNDLGVYEYVDAIYGIRGKITVVKKGSIPITGNVIGATAVTSIGNSLILALLVLVLLSLGFEMYRKRAGSYGR